MELSYKKKGHPKTRWPFTKEVIFLLNNHFLGNLVSISGNCIEIQSGGQVIQIKGNSMISGICLGRRNAKYILAH